MVNVFGPEVVTSDVTTGQASGVTVTGATLNGTVNPDGTTITQCEFDYVDDAEYNPSANNPYSAGGTVPCSSTPTGSSPVAVTAGVTGLTPGVLYHFRLVAANAQGTSDGTDQTFGTGAVSNGDYVTSVSSDATTLHAQVNPEGLDTTYQFQYGTTTGYGQSTPESQSIGSGTSAVTVSGLLTGLQPDTPYHYRVAATNSAGTSYGPDGTFTTQSTGAFSVPDGRAYEMVTPVEKNGGEVSFDLTGGVSAVYAGIPAASSTDGSKVTYGSVTAFPGSTSAQPTSQYISARGAGGWSTQAINPPYDAPGNDPDFNDPYWGFSPDLSTGLLVQGDPTLASGASSGYKNLYLRNDASGAFTTVTDATPSGASGNPIVYPAGASADFSHVIFAAYEALTPDAPAPNGGANLYEWEDGQLQLVSILPNGTPATPAGGSGFGSISNIGDGPGDAQNAISADGSKIFWTDNNSSNPAEEGLYVRIDGTRTVQADAPQGGSGSAGQGVYQDASSDGSKVVFTDGQALTADAGQADLYEYDVNTGTLTDLTAGVGGAGVQGVLGASGDLSHIYFAANGVLAPGAAQGNCDAANCHTNLYLWQDGTTKFIATLSDYDISDWASFFHDGAQASGPEGRTSSVTSDGLHLAFVANESLTGYDNTDATPGATCSADLSQSVSSSACDEVYLYDATSGQLTCASCSPTGERPTGSASLPGWSTGLTPPEYLTTDGNRLFFDSSDPLTSHDTDGLENVYEWERDGTGSCSSAPGCVYSISNGTSTDNSFFLAASASGNDAFFITRSQLVPQDTDQSMDVYDARVGGGFPYSPALPPCSGDACQAAGTAAPSVPVPATVTFSGPGNASPAPAPPRATVLNTVVHGSRFAVQVRVPGAGRITISGAGVGRVSRPVGKSGTYRLLVALTKSEQRLLKRKRALRLRLEVSYAPVGGGAQSASFTLTVKPVARHAVRRGRRANANHGGAR